MLTYFPYDLPLYLLLIGGAAVFFPSAIFNIKFILDEQTGPRSRWPEAGMAIGFTVLLTLLLFVIYMDFQV